MSSMLRRLLSHNTNSPRKFCSAAAAAAVNRELLEPPSPWLMLKPSLTAGGDDHIVYNLYSPIKDKVVSFPNRGGKSEADLMRDAATQLVGSSHGWLALFNSRSGDLSLSNPLSGRRIALPSSAADLASKSPRNMKVILSSSAAAADCRAVVVSRDRAAFCAPGRSREWTPLGGWNWAAERKRGDIVYSDIYGNYNFYADIVYSAAEKKFSGLTNLLKEDEMKLKEWDISKPVQRKTVQLDPVERAGPRSSWWFMGGAFVVAGDRPGQLFHVDIHHQLHNEKLPMDVRVYRIRDWGELELCSSLDDLVMFVGTNQSLAVKASQFPQLKPNSIYFSTVLEPYILNNYTMGNYIGVFDYQNKTCSPLYYPSILQEFNSQTYIEDYPKENMDTFVREKPRPQSQPWFTPTME